MLTQTGNSAEPPWYGPVCPVVWEEGSREASPYPDYFRHHQARMRYGTYQRRGYFLGSGTIESAGKQLTAARIKGAGMRWNVTDLNALLA